MDARGKYRDQLARAVRCTPLTLWSFEVLQEHERFLFALEKLRTEDTEVCELCVGV